MGKSKATPAQELAALVAEHEKSYRHWEHLYTRGGQDPTWPDGCILELTRNHIIWFKGQMKELCEKSGLDLPAEYARELPPEVDRDYMARADEIRAHAREALERYKADPDYKYLLRVEPSVDTKTANMVCLKAVLGYARGLRMAIEEDRLVDMRRHEWPDKYLESFRSCAEKLREAPEKTAPPDRDVQLTFFDIMAQEV